MPFLAALLGGILLIDWLSSANDRAVDRFQKKAFEVLRGHKVDHIKIPANRLFGEGSVAVCFFEAGYQSSTKISLPGDLRFVLPIIQKTADSRSLENWEIFEVSANGIERLAFSHGGGVQLSSRSGLSNQCIRPDAMLALGISPGLDMEALTIDFP